MQHDIYSLGVVLLEIGLWESFINYPPRSLPFPSPSLLPTDVAKPAPLSISLDELHPVPPPFVAVQRGERDTIKRATAIKTQLISLALEKLPAKMGNKYADIVLSCLRCLDRVSGTWSGEIEREGESRVEGGGFEDADVLDEDGIVVGVKYIERVLLKIQEISV